MRLLTTRPVETYLLNLDVAELFDGLPGKVFQRMIDAQTEFGVVEHKDRCILLPVILLPQHDLTTGEIIDSHLG